MYPFSLTADSISKVPSKLIKIDLLSDYIKDLDNQDLYSSTIFFTGNVFSRVSQKNINVGTSIIKKSLIEASGCKEDELDKIFLELSEIGETGGAIFSHSITPSKFTLEDIKKFISSLEANSGSLAKTHIIAELLKLMSSIEIKYLIKILTGDLRIGLKEAMVEDAISKAFDVKSKEIKWANMLTGDLGIIAIKAKNHDLSNIAMNPFNPIQVMLPTAQATSTDILARMGNHLYVEDKYDGIRCQLHKVNSKVKLFSRDMKETTNQFPEIVDYALQIDHDMILDGEVIGYKNEELLRFFLLQQRLGRKKISDDMLQKIPLVMFVYDIIYLDGEMLLDKVYEDRRRILEQIFMPDKTLKYWKSFKFNGFILSSQFIVDGESELENAFNNAKDRFTEGLIVKNPESKYLPGKRGIEWLKYKKTLEPIDAVITSVSYGHGKRRNDLSDYTISVWNEDKTELIEIGKVFSGVTEAEIKLMNTILLDNTLLDTGRSRTVVPLIVLEVQFESIQVSNRNKSGFAIRFPRITKIRLNDKSINDINTIKDIENEYKKFFAHQDIT